MELLERDENLQCLNDALAGAASGNGCISLIYGEAGIGKTALVEQFALQHSDDILFLRGTCDPLFTPHPLCPLHDIARQLPESSLAQVIWGDNSLLIFQTFLQELQAKGLPTMVVFEDVHWADEATLDLIRFLGRRIQNIPCLLILTYRDDELSSNHPLHRVLGYLSGKYVVRLPLEPLSKDAVDHLARQSDRSPTDLYAATNGNPFLVTELLVSDAEGVPPSIRV